MNPTGFSMLPPPSMSDYMGTNLEEISRVMNASIRGHERSQQVMIGPSEIGTPCNRALLMKIAKVQEPGKDRIAWKPTVGTALHAQQEEWFTKDKATGGLSWEIEERVTVGTIGGETVTGSTDLFVPETGAVVDWKFLGPRRLDEVIGAGKPKPLYETQAHLYGRGWTAEGYQVNTVMIVFLPREGEIKDTWTDPEDTGTGWWRSRCGDGIALSAPYNEQIALDALARADRMAAMLSAFGLDSTLKMPAFAPCQDRWCAYCNPPRTAPIATRSTSATQTLPHAVAADPFSVTTPAQQVFPAPIPTAPAANPFTI